MSQENELVVGSVDSGMGDTLVRSLNHLLMDDNENHEESVVVKVPEKPQGNGTKTSFMGRGLSLSSDTSSPSALEDNESSSGPTTREERILLLKDLLENYFSDNYLTRDIFLLKHFRRSKDGWISFKFMASYKRIKRVSKDMKEVEEAIGLSPQLELNAEGNKVRRLTPLPACIEEYIPTRMALVGNIPKPLRSLMALSKFMSEYGEVASLQVLRPGSNMPDFLWENSGNFPKLRGQWYGIVEFEEMSAAGQLVADINSGDIEVSPTWATELIMPWRSNKSADRIEIELMKKRCRSCPSSGYSSPCQTPEQSPGMAGGQNRRIRGVTKRERIIMSRSHQNNCCHSYACQHQVQPHHCHQSSYSHPTSPTTHPWSYSNQQKNANRSPKRYTSHSLADNSSNWRSPQ